MTVRDYPGGAEALAPRLGKSPTTLSHELRPPPGRERLAKLGLETAQDIMAFSGDYRILHAQAAELGQMVIPLPSAEGSGTQSAERIAALAREFAELVAEVALVVADGAVSDNELRRVERSWGDLQAAGTHLLRHLGALNQASKPASERTEAQHDPR